MLSNSSRAQVVNPAAERARVLVVDDEPGVRRLTTRMLEGEGFLVSEAGDGLEALHIIRSSGSEFDIVISDIVMPRLNGVDLLQNIVSVQPDLPVILMSGFGHARLTELGLAPPCGILMKPFPAEALIAEVRRCIRPRN